MQFAEMINWYMLCGIDGIIKYSVYLWYKMYCERCKKNEATIHLSEIMKDIKSEVHLCEHCAREVGLNTKISNFTLTLPEMLTFMNVDEVNDFQGKKRCSTCGCDFIEYKTNGKLGCPDCYLILPISLNLLLLLFMEMQDIAVNFLLLIPREQMKQGLFMKL
jgi:hypothetical protein